MLIGDVSGHGPDEAALGACLRIAWRTLTLALRPPQETLAGMQQMLTHERHAPDMFATLCVAVVAPDRASAEIFLAGHPPPVLADASGAAAARASSTSARRSASSTPPPGAPTPIVLTGDWSLLLYTDGLIEGRIGAGSSGSVPSASSSCSTAAASRRRRPAATPRRCSTSWSPRSSGCTAAS